MAVKIEDLKRLQMQSTYDELGIKPKWKPDHKAGSKFEMVCYYTARDVQKVLDSVCGIENWQNEPRNIDGKLYMGIGINIEDHGWNWKFDMGVESKVAKEKGEASDALKRAAVQWGIFRNSYEMAEILLPIAQDQKNPMTFPVTI